MAPSRSAVSHESGATAEAAAATASSSMLCYPDPRAASSRARSRRGGERGKRERPSGVGDRRRDLGRVARGELARVWSSLAWPGLVWSGFVGRKKGPRESHLISFSSHLAARTRAREVTLLPPAPARLTGGVSGIRSPGSRPGSWCTCRLRSGLVWCGAGVPAVRGAVCSPSRPRHVTCGALPWPYAGDILSLHRSLALPVHARTHLGPSRCKPRLWKRWIQHFASNI